MGTGGSGPPSLWKITKVILGFLRNTGTDPLDVLGPIASRGLSIRPSVKQVDDSKKVVMIPTTTAPDRIF